MTVIGWKINLMVVVNLNILIAGTMRVSFLLVRDTYMVATTFQMVTVTSAKSQTTVFMAIKLTNGKMEMSGRVHLKMGICMVWVIVHTLVALSRPFVLSKAKGNEL